MSDCIPQLMAQDGYAKNPDKGYVASSSWLIGNALKPNDLLGIANSRFPQDCT